MGGSGDPTGADAAAVAGSSNLGSRDDGGGGEGSARSDSSTGEDAADHVGPSPGMRRGRAGSGSLGWSRGRARGGRHHAGIGLDLGRRRRVGDLRGVRGLGGLVGLVARGGAFVCGRFALASARVERRLCLLRAQDPHSLGRK